MAENPKIELLAGWKTLAEFSDVRAATAQGGAAGESVTGSTNGITTVITTVAELAAAIETLESTPVSRIAIHVEQLKGQRQVGDVRAWKFRSIALAVETVTTIQKLGTASKEIDFYLINVNPDNAHHLAALFSIPATWIVHDVRTFFFPAWNLDPGIMLSRFFDTMVMEKCLRLGREDPRGRHGRCAEDPRAIDHRKFLQRQREAHVTLAALRNRYVSIGDLPAPTSPEAEDLQEETQRARPGTHTTAFVPEAAIARDLLAISRAQVQIAHDHDLLHNLMEIELPFAVANARMSWRGVYVSNDTLQEAAVAARKAVQYWASALARHGVKDLDDDDEFRQFVGAADSRSVSKRGSSREWLTESRLEELEHVHTAFRALKKYRKFRAFLNDPLFRMAPSLVDRRYHPDHIQLGAQTGRNACRNPRITGIGRLFRPVVVAPPGRAILTADYSQMEVAVAAGASDDSGLIDDFNSGDVYSATAQRFYRGELTPAEQGLSPQKFKHALPKLRERMKQLVLGILYQMKPRSMAALLRTSLDEALTLRESFLTLYPRMSAYLNQLAIAGMGRGYAVTSSGQRRYIPDDRSVNAEVRRSMINTPVQGSAASVFKLALVRLDQHFAETNTHLILPLHDEVVLECDLDDVERVAREVEFIMSQALRRFYPKLVGKITMNKDHPECWNKDGHYDSITRLLEDPEYSI